MPTVVYPEVTVTWPKGWCPDKVEPRKSWVSNDYLRICIDLDGVVCEYDFPKIVKDFFGIDLDASDIYAYDLPDVLVVSQQEINAMFEKQVYGSPTLVKGAAVTLTDWQSQGHELIIYSNRVKYMGETELIRWLKKYRIPFNFLTNGHGQYDVHIDDSAAKLMATNSRKKLLYTQPWNKRCLNIKRQLIRVLNWKEVNYFVYTLLDD